MSASDATEWTIYRRAHAVELGGVRVQLARQESRLICALADHPHQIFTSFDLVPYIWADGDEPERAHDYVRQIATRIRLKLSAAGLPNPVRPYGGKHGGFAFMGKVAVGNAKTIHLPRQAWIDLKTILATHPNRQRASSVLEAIG